MNRSTASLNASTMPDRDARFMLERRGDRIFENAEWAIARVAQGFCEYPSQSAGFRA
jgi:hypothetical protein